MSKPTCGSGGRGKSRQKVVRPGSADQDRFDRSRRIPWLDVEAIRKAKVLMVGAGAIGNEVGKGLALSGFEKITVVDMDHVEGSNLNRCLFFSEDDAARGRNKADAIAEGIVRLNSSSNPVSIVDKIEKVPVSIFKRHDVVLGCLDNINARIHVNSHAYHCGKVYVDGGMEGFFGRVTVSVPPDGACLQCGMNRSHARVAALRFSCTGKGMTFHEPRLAAEISTTSVISAVMVREILKVVCDRRDLLLQNSFYYDGQRNISEEYEVPLNPSCPVHAGSSYR